MTDHPSSSLARRLGAGRPAMAWSLALLFLSKGLVCLAALAFPISSREPTGFVAVVGTIGILGACGVWLFAEHMGRIGYQLVAGLGSILASALVAHARTDGGMMIAAFAYPWIAIYAAHFFSRRAVFVQAVVMTIGFTAALAVGDLERVMAYWVVVMMTIWSICLLLGNLSESLRRQTGTDQLTGLLNRSGFTAAAQRERELADRTGAPLSVVLIDLDDFKGVNDREGHMAGDRLLAGIARDWRGQMRRGDLLARLGGDEFALVLPATTPAGARTMIERLGCHEHPVTWSSGVSGWLPGEALEAPLALADREMYRVKRAKRPSAARPGMRQQQLLPPAGSLGWT